VVSRGDPRPRSEYRAWRTIATRWADNDAYGHVNNVVHYAWFDTAVNAWLLEAGLLDIGQGDPIGLVVETGCRYFAPLSFPETADVGIAIARLGTSSVTYRLGIFPEGQEGAAAEGEFTHVYVDRIGRKPRPLPDEWRATLETLL
jgi:acyl-CoA thioester hydrolase